MLARSLLLSIAGMLLWAEQSGDCQAGGEAEHRLMVAAAAEAMGFSPEHAKVLSDGSWSMDQNVATLAFRLEVDVEGYLRHRLKVMAKPEYARALQSDDALFDEVYFSPKGEMSRIGPSAFVHSLMQDPRARANDSNTPGLDHAFHRYVDVQTERLRESGVTLPRVRQAQLLMYGQYLHQVVDSFVHPHDPLAGHALEGHAPDRAITHPEQYKQAMVKVMQLLNTLPDDLRPLRHRSTALELDRTEGQIRFAGDLVDAVSHGYAPFYTPSAAGLSPADFSSAVEKLALPVIGRNVENFLNGKFSAADLDDRFTTPEFTKASFTPGGGDYEIRYGNQLFHVDNLVTWVMRQPEFEDLVQSVRGTVRREVLEWQLQRLAAIVVSNAVAEHVGGVMLRFEPGAPETAIDADQLTRLMDQARATLDEGSSPSVVLRLGVAAEEFQIISLKEVVDERRETLGSLTRVRGYILKDDDLLLVGQAEPGRPPIAVELLTVALNSVYRDGTSPFISLDPNPYDPLGPQVPRIGGLPEEHAESDFVRIMLDADYDMKRIMLGELDVDVPGFRSEFELLQEAGDELVPEMRRFWLTPLMASAADVLQNGPAVLFESRVQVLTERQKQAGEFIVASEANDSTAELGAMYLTHYYDQIAQRLDSFYQLYGVFDCAKLCAILRHKQVTHPLLEAIGRRNVRTAARRDGRGVREPYDGIGPKVVPGTLLMVGGGATSRQRLRPGSFVQSEAVGRLLAGETTLTLEAAIPLDKGAHPELLLGQAVQELSAGRPETCVAKCSRALDVDPEYWEARAYRALALLETGFTREALADLDVVAATDRRMLGLRGLAKLRIGDITGALADVEAAVVAAPDDEAVWGWNACVKTFAIDLDGAQRAVERLTALNPVSEQAEALLGVMLWLRRLDEQDARELSQAVLNQPFALVEALVDGHSAFEQMDFASAVLHFTRAVALAEAHDRHEAVRTFHTLERSLLALAYAEAMSARFERMMSQAGERATADGFSAPRQAGEQRATDAAVEAVRTDAAPADEAAAGLPEQTAERALPAGAASIPGVVHADRLIELHPEWPSGYFAKAVCALVQPHPIAGFEPSALLETGLQREHERDPLWRDWRTMLGEEDPARAMHAMGLQLSLNSLVSLARGGRVDAAALRGRLPTPYLRFLATQADLAGKMAGSLLPLFELLDAAVSVEEMPPAIAPDRDPGKDIARRLVERLVEEGRRAPLLAQIENAASGDELPMAFVTELVRAVIGPRHSVPVIQRIEAAGSIEQFQADPGNVRVVVDAIRARFREVYDETRDETPADLAACQVFTLFMMVNTLLEAVIGDPNHAMRLAEDGVGRLPQRASAYEGNAQLGSLRFYAHLTLIGTHLLTAHRDLLPPIPGFETAERIDPVAQLVDGSVDAHELVRRLRDPDRLFLERLQAGNSPFTYEIARTFVEPAQTALPLLALNQAALRCRDDASLPQETRDRILADIATATRQIHRELIVWAINTFVRPNQHLSEVQKRDITTAVLRGDDPMQIGRDVLKTLVQQRKGLTDEEREELLAVLNAQPGEAPNEKREQAMLAVAGDALSLVDLYAIWDPLVRAARSPSELEATKPLLSVMDLATSMASAQLLASVPSNPISQQVVSRLMSAMTASKLRVYEQVRLQTLRFLSEDLNRLAPDP